MVIGLVVLAAIGLRLANDRSPVPEPVIAPAEVQSPADSSVPAVARPVARPRLPAPAMEPLTNQIGALEAPTESSLAKLLKGEESPKLTAEQIAKYLEENKRTPESLITAAGMSGNLDLLREAATNFPGDPRVQLTLAFSGESPEEKSRALAAFRAADPGNSLGDYLAAHEDFKAGRTDMAVTNLLIAAGKGPLKDYMLDYAQAAEEAYLSAGLSVAESKVAGMFGVLLPHFQGLRDVGRQMVNLQNEYARAGDAESARAIWDIGMHLSNQMQTQTDGTLIGELVGMVTEKAFLNTLDANSVINATGLTVGQRLRDLEQHKQAIKDVAGANDLLRQLSEREVITYMDRMRLHGEYSALQWLKNKHGKP